MADLLYEKLGETPKIEYHPMQEGDVNYTHAQHNQGIQPIAV